MQENNKQTNTQEYIQKQIGVIRKYREITQENLAQMVNLSPKTISDIENNRRGVSVKTLVKICEVLDIDLENSFKMKNIK